jgi:hypothetical protein
VPYRPESPAIRIDGATLVESLSQYFSLTSQQEKFVTVFASKSIYWSHFNAMNPELKSGAPQGVASAR